MNSSKVTPTSPLSKVYKNTDEFVPEQLLPNHHGHLEPSWQDLMPTPATSGQGRGAFTPDRATRNEHAASPGVSDHLAQDQTATPDESGLQQEPPTTAIDLDLIRREALDAGVLKGRQQAEEDFGACGRALRATIEQLSGLHETILRNNSHEMHTMVMAIAEKVIRHSLSSEQSQTILATIEDAIRFAVKSEEFEIRINPDDLEVIKNKKQEIIDEISGLNNITFKGDNSIERGGCRLESVNCTVDATIGSQLQVIEESLHASRDSGPPSEKKNQPS
jgi:flagellar assembly protein FliH